MSESKLYRKGIQTSVATLKRIGAVFCKFINKIRKVGGNEMIYQHGSPEQSKQAN